MKINEYPLESLIFGDNDFYDIDFWNGIAFQTRKIKGSAIRASVGFTHYIGEEYLGGIIYYLYKDSLGVERGLVVNTTESTAQWQAIGTVTGANRTEDGIFNTNLMTGSPAETYIATLGTGWYLPSIDELNLLWDNRYLTQKALRAGSYTLLSHASNYWSSLEATITTAFMFGFINGFSSSSDNKGVANSVRGIKAF